MYTFEVLYLISFLIFWSCQVLIELENLTPQDKPRLLFLDSVYSISFFLTILFLFLHLKKEHPRWQLFTSYFAVLLDISFAFYTLWGPPNGIHYIILAIMIISILISVFFNFLVPITHFPTPSGKYPVGTFFVHAIVESESEILKKKHYFPQNFEYPAALQHADIKIWYPSEKNSGKDSSYYYYDSVCPKVLQNGLIRALPGWASQHMSYITVNAKQEALPSLQKPYFPVLLLSHGLSGVPESYTIYAEELASRGYVVIGIWHTDGSAACNVTPEGNLFSENPYLIMGKQSTEEKLKFRNFQLLKRIEDVEICLNILDTFNQDKKNLFYQKLNLKKVGIFGQSFGGVTALMAAKKIPRIIVAVSLDGWMEPATEEMILEKTHSSLFCLNSHYFQWKSNLEAMQKCLKSTDKQGYLFKMLKTGHQNFSDMPILAPILCRLISFVFKKMIGDIDFRTCFDTTNELLDSFFEKHLINEEETRFRIPDSLKDIIIEEE